MPTRTHRRFPPRLIGLLAIVSLAGAACVGGDDPEQPLPCEFYRQQRDTGVDVTIPAECDDVPSASTTPVPTG